jgi:hypothetical protein
MTEAPIFHESAFARPIRDLGLAIPGTPLEPVVREFEAELRAVGITRVRPRFYLSTEWGVPFETVAIAIPFYLAHPRLTALHAERGGHVEGSGRADILRYLRHEMGHVLNYAYCLYDDPRWVELFGAITQPYEEVYHPEPFSRAHVHHLPGWYAQKHPDEDWAETFAVWMTPGHDWRAEYAGWPQALAKLEYCERTMAELRDRDPVVTEDELDEDVGEIEYSLDEFYRESAAPFEEVPPGLDGALRSIFEDLAPGQGISPDALSPAAGLIAGLERDLARSVYRWTGHFPERALPLVRHLARRADELRLGYAPGREREAIVALTTLVTALAMNHVHRGRYLP